MLRYLRFRAVVRIAQLLQLEDGKAVRWHVFPLTITSFPSFSPSHQHPSLLALVFDGLVLTPVLDTRFALSLAADLPLPANVISPLCCDTHARFLWLGEMRFWFTCLTLPMPLLFRFWLCILTVLITRFLSP